jgi:GNAT superfamily N-acetyltransferase
MKTDKDINIRYFKSCNVESVRSFYTYTAYKKGDMVKDENEIVAAYDGDKMVGVFRLCKENNIIVLRGFFILAEYQKKGIGTKMLGLFENELCDVECYLNCRNGLNQFYQKANFEICGNNARDFLKKRVAGYNNPELNILVRRVFKLSNKGFE